MQVKNKNKSHFTSFESLQVIESTWMLLFPRSEMLPPCLPPRRIVFNNYKSVQIRNKTLGGGGSGARL